MERQKISERFVADNNKKKIRTGVKNRMSKSALEKKSHLNVKANNSNVFGRGNSLSEELDKKIEIFHQKEMKKSTLPSISAVLSSNNKNLVLSLLNNSVKEPEQCKIKEHTNNSDVFINKATISTFNHSKQFGKEESLLLDRNHKKSHDYSISSMFSDGLSDKENSGQEFSYVSSSDESQTDLLPPPIKVETDSSAGKTKSRKEREVEKTLVKNGPGLGLESFDRELNSFRVNFGKNKPLREIVNGCEIENSVRENNKFKISSGETEMNSSSTFVTLRKEDLGIESLLHNSIDKSRQSEILNNDKNGVPCAVCGDDNSPLTPTHRIDENNKSHLASNMFDLRNPTHEIMYNVEFKESESDTINIAVSECNLDHAIDSEDLLHGSIEMLNKRAMWYMDENNLYKTEPDLINVPESTRMNYNEDNAFDLSDPICNILNLSKNDSVIGSGEVNNNSQNILLLSDPLRKLLNTGSQLSNQSNSSLASYIPEFDLTQKCKMSVERKGLIYPESRQASFGISQSAYIKQRSPFFNRKKCKDDITTTFEPSNSIAKNIEEFRPRVHLPAYSNDNCTSKYKFIFDCHKGNERQISYSNQQRATSLQNLEKKFMDFNAKKWTSSNLINKCLKRRYPSDNTFDCYNMKLEENCKIFEKDGKTDKNIGADQNILSENHQTSIDHFSCSSFEDSNVPHENVRKYFTLSSFWNVSDQVQSLVKELLDEENEINCKIFRRCGDDNTVSLKRRRLDIDGEKKEKRIDIDPEMLLSNYSSEYDRSFTIERFRLNKINQNKMIE